MWLNTLFVLALLGWFASVTLFFLLFFALLYANKYRKLWLEEIDRNTIEEVLSDGPTPP